MYVSTVCISGCSGIKLHNRTAAQYNGIELGMRIVQQPLE